MAKIQNLPGFRDFAPDECAVRNYIFDNWKKVARNYGFVEYEVPVIESTELYLKKSGGEIATQLFRFEDQGGRDITIRPEVTPSLARLVIDKQRAYQKPMKWFQIGQCFRYEKPQKGRTREFYQYNVDLIGEGSAGADAELIALSIDVMRGLGFKKGDFVVRLSNREAWLNFAEQRGISEAQFTDFLAVIDRWEKLDEEKLEEALQPFGVTYQQVEDFIDIGAENADSLVEVIDNLDARGMRDFVKVDLTIVRGLAYYTGTVFEVFDTKHNMRAVAGGGRYDDLISTLSAGKVDLPTIGFGMGDVVIRNLIEATPHAAAKMGGVLQKEGNCDVFVVIAEEDLRPEALELISVLRQEDIKTEYSLTPQGFGKQFKKAEQARAKLALIVGTEYPVVKVKNLANRTETDLDPMKDLPTQVIQKLVDLTLDEMNTDGPLIA